MRLPGWVVDNRTAVLRDVEPFRAIPPASSWELVALASRTGAAQLRWDPRPGETLAFRDPLPAHSVAALSRLRAAYRTRR